MTLHLLRHSPSPLALQILAAQPASQTGPTVILLSSSDTIPPAPPSGTAYYVKENPLPGEKQAISYTRLVDMIFQADRVVTW